MHDYMTIKEAEKLLEATLRTMREKRAAGSMAFIHRLYVAEAFKRLAHLRNEERQELRRQQAWQEHLKELEAKGFVKDV